MKETRFRQMPSLLTDVIHTFSFQTKPKTNLPLVF